LNLLKVTSITCQQIIGLNAMKRSKSDIQCHVIPITDPVITETLSFNLTGGSALLQVGVRWDD
jgi:hypothetical protein